MPKTPPRGATRTPRYALGVVLMLVNAIEICRERHGGQRPAEFLMHPGLRGPLIQELHDAYGMRFEGVIDGPDSFEGVAITWNRRVKYPIVVPVSGSPYLM